MSFSISTDEFEITAKCTIPSFHKRGALVMSLTTSAVEMALKFCEALTEDELGGDYIDWKQRDEIISAFLDEGMFNKWALMVANDLGEYAVQIPD